MHASTDSVREIVMPGVKKILNFHESAVDKMIGDYARERGYRVGLKPRLRDVIDIDGMTLDGRERNFAFTSHIDFVVFDEQTLLPVLAIEYDGPQHADATQAERDRIKNRLLDAAGLQLLRIDSQYARKEGRWRVLAYVLDMFEAGTAFYRAQEEGLIHEDEPFIHNLLLDTSTPGRLKFTGLDTDALASLGERLRARKILWYAQWWRSTDNGGTEARAVAGLPSGQYLSSLCNLRRFAITGISALELAEELAMAELGWMASAYEAGEAVALNAEQGSALLDELSVKAETGLKSAYGWELHASAGGAANPARRAPA